MKGDRLVFLDSRGRIGRIRLPNFDEGEELAVVLEVASKGYEGGGGYMIASPYDECFYLEYDDEMRGHFWRPSGSSGPWRAVGPEFPSSYVALHPKKPIAAVSAYADGARSSDGVIELWHIDRDPHLWRTLRGHMALVRFLSFNADGTRLAGAGADGTIRLWNIT
ncbi:WD40 repeat domain-containing protein [Streptomyces sp. V4I2]|uniref:WD40 repeat domain-containing protein n=1 Tax=Streptomyces sp. V4I2 TaxID=3042280 RepID=UPI00278A93B1|nr:hypothetical protein [Streptomyces sp. V4I2]MDQ1047948.1 WD40 repeat protein [Streptomyces sp. V4I2]